MERKTKPARPADVAVAANRLMYAHLLMLWRVRYRRIKVSKRGNHIGNALQLMMVSIVLSIMTADNKPPTVAELSRRLNNMPWQTVRKSLQILIKDGSAFRQGKRYAANLDKTGTFVTRARLDWVITNMREALEELVRLAQELEGILK